MLISVHLKYVCAVKLCFVDENGLLTICLLILLISIVKDTFLKLSSPWCSISQEIPF